MEKPKLDEIKKLQDQKLKERTEAQLALNSVIENKNLEIALKFIYKLCGPRTNPVTLNKSSGDVNVNATIYNNGRASVWLDIQNLLSAEAENQITKREV